MSPIFPAPTTNMSTSGGRAEPSGSRKIVLAECIASTAPLPAVFDGAPAGGSRFSKACTICESVARMAWPERMSRLGNESTMVSCIGVASSTISAAIATIAIASSIVKDKACTSSSAPLESSGKTAGRPWSRVRASSFGTTSWAVSSCERLLMVG
eukprot:scaffold32972_cov28-Tisochrysis_lutea.AAC.8